jgi:hypothetical protein
MNLEFALPVTGRALLLSIAATLAGCSSGGGNQPVAATVNTTPATSSAAVPAAMPSPFDPVPASTSVATQAPPSSPVPEASPSAAAPAERIVENALAPVTDSVTTASSNTVQWTSPTQNRDGSSMVLAGFTVVYGPSSTQLYHSVRLSNPSISRYVMDALPTGTYYVGVKAVSSQGIESTVSNLVKMVII